MLRKLQAPFGVIWSLLELKTALQGAQRGDLCHFYVSVCVILLKLIIVCLRWSFLCDCIRLCNVGA